MVLIWLFCMISPLSKTTADTPGSNPLKLLSEGRSRRLVFGVETRLRLLSRMRPVKRSRSPPLPTPRGVEKRWSVCALIKAETPPGVCATSGPSSEVNGQTPLLPLWFHDGLAGDVGEGREITVNTP